ncbi:MAG: hypothetical protein M1827_002962 [Pycnora praestabilis]|nr:MAG: hypothetical protein M1827_002962 [Pycnora praestabilis]
MRGMRPLLLPLLVEARRSKESIEINNMDSPELPYSVSGHSPSLSSASEQQSPNTPTFSARGHSRYPSSTSSLASSPTTYDQMDSTPAGKRVLPDLKEEPQEREDESNIFNDSNRFYGCFCDDFEYVHEENCTQSTIALPSATEYDLTDGFFSDGEFSSSPRMKKRRAGDSPLSGFATRIGNRFPSISRRLRDRKTASTKSAANSLREDAPSRAASSRSSSLTGSIIYNPERLDSQLPPTPAKSVFNEREEDNAMTPIDIEKANRPFEEGSAEILASTPLLPPLMVEASTKTRELPVQSPLQSPTVADPSDSFSIVNTPIDTPQLPGLPSPPLSTKPSISSLHKQRLGHLVPSSEIPPIVIADPHDEWANILGHANFNIHPEPYFPDTFDLKSCKQMRANWDLARCNYMKHLVRTGEHYGATSKTYKLTEEKWAEIDVEWKKSHELIIAKTSEDTKNAESLRQTAMEPTALMKIPSLNGPCSDGKFPKLGDEDIVGPMVQIASTLQRRPSRKATFLKFLQDIISPTSVMMGREKSK